MNHRDRVLTALNHEKPDRCPMQALLSHCAGGITGQNIVVDGGKFMQ